MLSPAGFFGRVSRFRALLPLSLMRLGALFSDRILRVIEDTIVRARDAKAA